MAGHVFIMHGDLTRVSCDAWLMPCGIEGRASAHWREVIEAELGPTVWPELPEGWSWNGARCARLWPEPRYDRHGERMPTPWLANVGGGRRTTIAWFVQGVREFMAAVAASPEVQAPRHDRVKPLVALPIVGTGDGGARSRGGDVVRALLPCLYESARVYDLDVALVIKHHPDYAAAQRERLRYHERGVHRWPELDQAARAQADALAARASSGQLVLFVGSGVSVGAGLPTWGEFLRQLSRDPEQRLALDWDDLGRWSYGDQARIIERGFGGREVMGQAIARHLDRAHYSLTHGFLAALPCEEVVTTNYDRLFELASAAIDRPAAALPYENASGSGRWILKMHGCITRPEDIVVTREDFLRYASRRNALAGIVQALLITRHMLFVGFSLDDDNFHRIADDVRRTVRLTPEHAHEPFGTSLVLVDRPYLAELWRGEIELITLRPLEPERTMRAQSLDAARQLEIFLDYLLAQVTDPSYLLDDRFESLLDEDEQALRELLLELVTRATPQMRRTPAWLRVEALLQLLGYRPDPQGAWLEDLAQFLVMARAGRSAVSDEEA